MANLSSLSLLMVLVFPGAWLAGCNETQRSFASFTGSGRSATKVELPGAGQTLRVYNFANYLGHTTLQSFEERTGSKVLLSTYESNEELMRSLAAGAPYDVVFPSSYAVERLVRQDLLRPMERERVPNLIQVPDLFRNPPVDPSLRHCIPYTWSLLGLGLASQVHTPGPTRGPDSLAMVFAGQGPKVLMLDDMRATLGMALHFLGLSASTREQGDLDRAQALLLGQAPRVLRYVADTGPALESGEATLALGWSGDVMGVVRRNHEVHFTVPREGTLLYVDYACVPQQARNPELGFAFLNHLLDPQVAAEITNSAMFATPNIEAQRHLSGEARWLWGTLDALKGQDRYEMIRDVGPALPQYETAWRTVKSKVPSAPH